MEIKTNWNGILVQKKRENLHSIFTLIFLLSVTGKGIFYAMKSSLKDVGLILGDCFGLVWCVMEHL